MNSAKSGILITEEYIQSGLERIQTQTRLPWGSKCHIKLTK